jgi:hypothetical protein
VLKRCVLLVQADLARTLPEVTGLRLAVDPDSDWSVFVQVNFGEGRWAGVALPPDYYDEDIAEPVAVVADAIQELVVERVRVWPLCPEHGLGLHPCSQAIDSADDDSWWTPGPADWRCQGDGGHVISAIGALGR